MHRAIYPFTELDFDGQPPDQCEWFARCANEATHMVQHPILEWVPTCDEHAEFAAK